MSRILLAQALLLVACSSSKEPPRFMIARGDVQALDDASVRLRHGFGVQVVETRGDRVRTSEGRWFPRASLEPVTPATSAPASMSRAPRPALGPTERWVDVDIAAQRVTAFEGDRPVRAMKASTGVGEEGAMYSTPRGTFRVYAKLRAATMASEPGDPHPYRFEAVPDVQYFNREIAFHGAYWHRRFGERVSHGCVNLAPADAEWLFEFTTPTVGATERERAGQGTFVRVR